MDDNDDDLADFNPPQTQSVGVERTKQHDPIDDVPVQPVHSTSMGIGTQMVQNMLKLFKIYHL